MKVLTISPVGFASNGYLLTADGKTAVAIDPAQPRFLDEAIVRGLRVEYVLLTHGHFDHIGGCAALQRMGAKIGCLQQEKSYLLSKVNRELTRSAGMEVEDFSVDFTFSDGETLSLCGMELQVIATPGHTAGSACFACEEFLFTGDTLFYRSVGRTDLPTGDWNALVDSVKRLYALEGNYRVLSGHGEESDLQSERTLNGYIRK